MPTNIKISISASTFPTKFGPIVFSGDLYSSIPQISSLGYNGIELFIRRPEDIDIEKLSSLLDKNKLELSVIAAVAAAVDEGLNMAHPDEKKRKKMVEIGMAQIKIAGRFGTNVPLGIVRGSIAQGSTREDTEKRFIESLRRYHEVAVKEDVLLLLEPVNRYEINYINRVEEAGEFLEKVNLKNVKLCVDTFHMNIEEYSIIDTFERAWKHIAHIHFADSNRQAPGQGHTNFPEIISFLKDKDYSGYLAFEILPLPSPQKAAELGIRYIRNLLEG